MRTALPQHEEILSLHGADGLGAGNIEWELHS
jgi:hypothetical protein